MLLFWKFNCFVYVVYIFEFDDLWDFLEDWIEYIVRMLFGIIVFIENYFNVI